MMPLATYMPACLSAGSYWKFQKLNIDSDWLPLWMQGGGYQTYLIGAEGSRAACRACAGRPLEGARQQVHACTSGWGCTRPSSTCREACSGASTRLGPAHRLCGAGA